MCGIAGIVSANEALRIDPAAATAMRDVLRHRGPDDRGCYDEPGAFLASQRLSVLDLSANGRMPMSTPDGRYWITYNGEIYNHRELRRDLEARGHEFRSHSDSEVLLHLFAEFGPSMLPRLNGMFAVAIWDSSNRELFLARDRLGIKPLFYTVRDGQLYFASEPKALRAAGVRARFDATTWEELLCFRFVAGERTPYEGVSRLLAGHHLTWKGGQARVQRWWNLSTEVQRQRADVAGDPVAWFERTFDESVRLRRVESDVPVGVLLSGGMDSSSIGASLRHGAAGSLSSFTVRFPQADFDEGPLARDVARAFGLEFHERTVAPNELLALQRQATWFHDEPLAHGNDPHILAISQLAKPLVTVLLSGEGADETLGGYVRYQPLRFAKALRTAMAVWPPVPPVLRLPERVAKFARFASLGDPWRMVLYNACNVLPPDLRALGMVATERFAFREHVLAEAADLYPGDLVRQAMYSDQHTFLASLLDRNDRMTMGASVECRVPFLDYHLLEGTAALPSSVVVRGRRGKDLLRRSVGARLPRSVRRHRKWGFGVPWTQYYRTVPELRDLVRSLASTAPVCDGPLDRVKVEKLTNDYLAGDDRPAALVHQLASIALWYDVCCR